MRFYIIFTLFIFSFPIFSNSSAEKYVNFRKSLEKIDLKISKKEINFLKNGIWPKDKGEKFEKLLKKHNKNLQETKKFLNENSPFDSSFIVIKDGKLPEVLPMLYLVKLILLEGKYFESQQDYQKSFNIYFLALKLSEFVKKEVSLITYITSMALLEQTLDTIFNSLKVAGMGEKDYNIIHQSLMELLQKIKKSEFNFIKAMEGEHTWMLEEFKKGIRVDFKKGETGKTFDMLNLSNIPKSQQQALIDKIVKRVDNYQKELLAKYKKAYKTKDIKEWNKVSKYYEKRGEEMTDFIKGWRVGFNVMNISLVSDFKSDLMTDIYSFFIAEILIAIATPNYVSYLKREIEVFKKIDKILEIKR